MIFQELLNDLPHRYSRNYGNCQPVAGKMQQKISERETIQIFSVEELRRKLFFRVNRKLGQKMVSFTPATRSIPKKNSIMKLVKALSFKHKVHNWLREAKKQNEFIQEELLRLVRYLLNHFPPSQVLLSRILK